MVEFTKLVDGIASRRRCSVTGGRDFADWIEHRKRVAAPHNSLEVAMELRRAQRAPQAALARYRDYYANAMYVFWYEEPCSIDPSNVIN